IVAPRTPTQARVQKLWTEVLGLAQLSVETPLVEAGMDSIMAIRVCAKLRAMGYAVSVATLFAYPTVAALADALDAQQPAPAAPRAATAPPAAAPASVDRAPLTEVQQAMIATSELHPDEGTYIEQIVYLVDDDVTETVISRFHACLSAQPLGRLTVADEAGQWAFVTAPQPAPAPAFVDGGDAQALGAFLAADRARGFTLSQAPLWRLSAVGIGGGRRCIVWTHHHVLLDGWSLLALQAEMLRSAAGEAPRPLGNGLSDLAAFHGALQGWTESHTREAEAFWTRTLEGVEITEPLQVSATPPVADIEGETDASLSSGALTLDRVYGLAAREGVRVDRVTVAVEKRTLAALCTLANVTPSTVLRSAWGRVYAHHVNRSDVLLGVTSSGRSLPMDGLEGFVGCTLVTFPVRMKLDPEQPITEWLQASHAAALEAMEWEHLSFARIADLATGGTSARLLHHIFVYEDGYGLEAPAATGVTPLGSIDQTDYPLIVQVDATHDPVEVHFSFDPSRYSRDHVASVARRFRLVLDQMVRSPHARVGDIELVSATEKRRLLAEQPVQVDLGPLNVPARIDRVITSTPDAPALCFEGETISYGSLDTAIEAIRARLQDAGVREGQAVALIMPRSPLVIASILAVWRIGAHYVPLDPALPTLPATQMLIDAAPAAVLTAGDVPDLQAKTAGQCHISLPALSSLLSPPPPRRDRPRLSGDLDALAYVLYTSGSTGAPKGVMQTHHTLLNMGMWMAREMHIDASDRMVYKTPYTFDVSLPDMFYALCVGGTVVIARDGMHADPDYLIDLVNATQATIIQFVPSMLDVFMTSGGLEKTPSLRWVMAAGERLTLAQVRTFQRIQAEHGLGVTLRNLYGPTETFYITDVRITDDDAARDTDPPIGTVFPNNAAYVLDRLGALCGTGVSGELVIAGNHVARGYLRRPELTAARFIADPFSHRVNRGESTIARAYRTGDTCFWGSDHQLHYLGRSDDQVKINGVRIELGAVVAALTQIRGVHRAAVTPSEEKPPVLLAFVQAESGTLDAEQVRAECTRRLPPAAVPAHVMVVDTTWPSCAREPASSAPGRWRRRAFARHRESSRSGWPICCARSAPRSPRSRPRRRSSTRDTRRSTPFAWPWACAARATPSR
ncbi:MAG: amino acid adenylation domain-containing protein, partial [Proteobacteria bacterium]|nr:amino acid adenylation domain-containing protein [Pseudomonadota bacterium]